MSTNRLQFTGLSSGLDTDSIVKSLLTTQQTRIDNANHKKTTLEWKKETWSKVNDSINKFYNDFVNKLRLQSTFDTSKATTSSSAVTVTSSAGAPQGNHEVTVTNLAEGVFKATDITLPADYNKVATLGTLGMTEASTTITVNGNSVEIKNTDTIQSLETKLKAADDSLNVNFDLDNGKLFMSTKETGKNASIELTGATTFLNKLGIVDLAKTSGEDAAYTYNGVSLTSSSNTVQVNGLSMTLNEEIATPVTIQVSRDVDKTVEFISSFVDAYNTLTTDLNKKYSAASTSLKPLSNDEQANMTDKQIEDHEAAIKDSLLRRDSSLKTVIDSMRSTLQGVVKGNTYGCLAKIGITTGDHSEKGKLILDKSKLKEALEEDSDAVMELFTKTGETDSAGNIIAGTAGIASDLNSSLQSLFKRVEGLKSYQSYYNDKINEANIRETKEKVSELEKKYKSMEQLYYKKFTAMEKAMSMLNSQGSSISSMLG